VTCALTYIYPDIWEEKKCLVIYIFCTISSVDIPSGGMKADLDHQESPSGTCHSETTNQYIILLHDATVN